MGHYGLGLVDIEPLQWYLRLGLEETFEIICSYKYLKPHQVKMLIGIR